MKSRSKFYLTPDDILDNKKVELRQKKTSSDDSKLGQSGNNQVSFKTYISSHLTQNPLDRRNTKVLITKY